jgi:hypothetical protein
MAAAPADRRRDLPNPPRRGIVSSLPLHGGPT